MSAKGYLLFCLLVTGGLIVSGHVYHMSSVRMEGPGHSTCPSETQLDAVRAQLSKKISGLVYNFCGGPGWSRVAYLNMSEPNTTCPNQWRLYEEGSLRLCGRPVGGASCDSVQFSVDNYAYTRVCGRVTGYQYASPFASTHIVINPTPGNAINEPYLDGVSITYGSPRKHIWSFYGSANRKLCCSTRHIDNVESLGFIGNDSFCDTGNPESKPWGGTLFTYHPLWEGDTQCAGSSTCCTLHAGPWFHVTLDSPSIQDIEVRICSDQYTNNEDTPVELIEIYVR